LNNRIGKARWKEVKFFVNRKKIINDQERNHKGKDSEDLEGQGLKYCACILNLYAMLLFIVKSSLQCATEIINLID